MATTRIKVPQHGQEQHKIFSPGSPDSDTLMQKDETEARLEKLVFGDEAGFLEALGSNNHGQALVLERDTDQDLPIGRLENSDLEDVADEELFVLDSVPSGFAPAIDAVDATIEVRDDGFDGRHPLWEDSDDERLQVSLASNLQLRKLRNTEAEDVVNGKEYIKRLRRQYERLHPPPAWATWFTENHLKKRKRRRSDPGDGDLSDFSAAPSDSEDDIFPTQPLAALLRSTESLTKVESLSTGTKRRKLRAEVIDIQRTKGIPGTQPSSIDSLSFHPTLPLLLSSGPSSTIYLHHVSPHSASPNPLLTSLHLKKTPLHATAFTSLLTNDDNSDSLGTAPVDIIITSRRRYFYTWNLADGSIAKTSNTRTLVPDSVTTQRTMEDLTPSPCGRYLALVSSSRKGGTVVSILDNTTHQYKSSVRIDSINGIASLAFWETGNGLIIAGKNGEVNEVSIPEQRIVARWIDEGAVGTTVIALGGNTGETALGGSRWIAIGSSSGIVNIYDRRNWTAETLGRTPRPKPTKVFEQLTTPVSHLLFSVDGQMLVMASRWKKDALKLVHLPSCTMYRNWPTSETPLGRVSSVAISADGGYLAVGNERGKIRLWEIRG